MLSAPNVEPAAEPVSAGILAPFARVKLAAGVILVVQDELIRLLDFERGRFYALNVTGSTLLRTALKIGKAEAIHSIALAHGLTQERVSADLERLLTQLQRKRLLAVESTGDAFIVPGWLKCWLLLTLAWLSVRILGWAKTVRWWQIARTGIADPWHSDRAPFVERVDHAVRSAASTHPLNPQCKERSLAAWYILRNQCRLPAELVVGVLTFPFQAHAWVECGPLTVTDEQDRCGMYTPAVRYQ